MKYKTLIGFSGAVSAPANAIIEIANEDTAQDLLQAGYIIAVEEKGNNTGDDADKVVKKGTTRTRKKKATDGE